MLFDYYWDVEMRLAEFSFALKHALGNARIKIMCPKCKEWSYLELKEVEVGGKKEKMWVCLNCNPF